MSLGVVFCPPWLLNSLSPASWPPLPRERLKPHAIDIRVNIDPLHWFLSPPRDTRSSLYLEDAATEFQVQGLELDWTIVTWDADLRWLSVGSNTRARAG